MKKPKTVGANATVIDGTRGNSFPLGATVAHGGVNFSVYSKNAEAVELLLFEHAEDSGPSRNRQVKNFLTVTLLAGGAPMLLMGDEVRRTQQGNNNAYGQDNEISWLDWSRAEKHSDLLRFVRRLIADRLKSDVSRHDPGLTLNQLIQKAKIVWHGVKLNRPDWSADSHAIAITMTSLRDRLMFHMMINAFWEELKFEVPSIPESSGSGWMRWIDTFQEPPDDICSWDEAAAVRGDVYAVQPRSLVFLAARLKNHSHVSGPG